MAIPIHSIVKNASGERFVKLGNGSVIPADIAALAVGKDAWMANIHCKCRDCKAFFPLRELQGNGQWCEPCQVKSLGE
jgi:hypothetical protein